ncbi:MAG: hypothetical protein DVS81_16055 [Candidatus Accumulibacter meliphilus]|uniref:Uncharacterized protein n=1 Tax=Candidatus Accumulibacter meliphilus TaxID=2211374 RepID=A0A369XM46_9PROT|nr:MAG: hypothetical protein DVS81_16055 [Candidatus Accumulibacter meliphilus]
MGRGIFSIFQFRYEVDPNPSTPPRKEPTSDALLVLWHRDGDRQAADSIDIARSRRCSSARRGLHLVM